MIKLSNGHEIQYVNQSGSLGFDGLGWWWERPLVWFGLIKLQLFATILRTLTYEPRLYPVSNLSWIRVWTWLPWSPWSCVRFLSGGAANKVGLYNPGIKYFCEKIVPKLDFKKYKLIASIWGETHHLVEMAKMLRKFPFIALELNVSCPNTVHGMSQADQVIEAVAAVKEVWPGPIIIKVSTDQDFLAIARGSKGKAEAINLNSVVWKMAFPDGTPSPLSKIGPRGSGDGGVSGKPAQKSNWKAVKELAEQGSLPVIATSIMEYEDLATVEGLGAKAFAFGAIYMRTPCKPTQIVQRDMFERGWKSIGEALGRGFLPR